MTKEAKTTRNLKVIEQSGYRYQATPTVMLKGVSQNTISKKLRRVKKQLTEMCRKAV